MKSRIMYIECKADGLNGPARIGRVSFSKTGATLYYKGKSFQSLKGAFKSNYFDVETGDRYWISGPKRNGEDRLYVSNIPGGREPLIQRCVRTTPAPPSLTSCTRAFPTT